MIVVVDANILVSALLGSRHVYSVLAHSDATFFAPDVIFDEVRRHRAFICERACISYLEFEQALLRIRALLWPVLSVRYSPYLPQARAALPRDATDAPYLACALAVGADAVWTHDKDFSTQTLVRVVTTRELL